MIEISLMCAYVLSANWNDTILKLSKEYTIAKRSKRFCLVGTVLHS